MAQKIGPKEAQLRAMREAKVEERAAVERRARGPKSSGDKKKRMKREKP